MCPYPTALHQCLDTLQIEPVWHLRQPVANQVGITGAMAAAGILQLHARQVGEVIQHVTGAVTVGLKPGRGIPQAIRVSSSQAGTEVIKRRGNIGFEQIPMLKSECHLGGVTDPLLEEIQESLPLLLSGQLTLDQCDGVIGQTGGDKLLHCHLLADGIGSSGFRILDLEIPRLATYVHLVITGTEVK